MTAFRFRLQQVLRLSEAEGRARAAELGWARGAEADARAVLDTREQEAERRLSAARGDAAAALDLEAWSADRSAYLGARRSAAEAAGRVNDAAAVTAQAHGALLSARQRQEALLRLRQRRHTEWQASEARQEQSGLDEVGSRRSRARMR